MAGPNRKSRRVMEDENKKLRKKARREYNETVRGLAEFVKKRDKRVIDMQLKRNAEMEKKREEEKQRKKELEREKAQKARNYEEPGWAKVEEEVENDEAEDVVEEKRKEFYCVVCSKKFKSDKQWRNHEQSKKHKEKVAELREAFSEEDKEYEAATEGNKSEAEKENGVGYLSADDEVNELVEQFEGNVGIQEDDSDGGKSESSEVNKFADIIDNDNDDNNNGGKGIDASFGSDDDETSILEAMLSGHRSRNKLGNRPKAPAKKVQMEINSDELGFMEYNETKGSRRDRGGRRRRGKRQEKHEKEAAAAAATKAGVAERNGKAEGHDEDAGEPSSHSLPESGTKRADEATERHHNHSQQAANKKATTKKENASKPKVASKVRKQKVAANGSDNMCDKCGEQFETRNKLHKHLGDTGHALIRSR